MTPVEALFKCPPMGNAGVDLCDNKEVPALKGASLFDLLEAVHTGY